MSSQAAGKLKLCLALVFFAGCISLSGCTTPRQDVNAEADDSFESYNRAMHKFNYAVDRLILKPVVTGYQYAVPQEGRQAVSNVLSNLYSPVIFANSVLQGDPQNSFATLWRFILNSTFGLGGIYDFAANAGLKNRPADFGETLAMCGVGSGPYVVLPLIGPSNIRDTVGRIGDMGMNPFTYMPAEMSYPVWGAMAVDTRSRNDKIIEDIYETSLDPYSTFRSGYMQKRASEINRAEISREKALEQMYSK